MGLGRSTTYPVADSGLNHSPSSRFPLTKNKCVAFSPLFCQQPTAICKCTIVKQIKENNAFKVYRAYTLGHTGRIQCWRGLILLPIFEKCFKQVPKGSVRLFQPISKRGHIPANHRTERTGNGSDVIIVVALAMHVQEFGEGRSY